MSGKISIPVELPERYKLMIYYLGKVGALDRRILLEIYTYGLILEQEAEQTIDVIYDTVLQIPPKTSDKLPFKQNHIAKLFDQEIFAMDQVLGMVKRAGVDVRGRNTTAYELTESGTRIYEILKSGRRTISRYNKADRKLIYAIGHFAEPQINELFEKAIGPACIEVGFKPRRIDSGESAEVVAKEMFADLGQCELIVVDLTYLSPAFYFQIGYFYGVGVPIVFTCRIDVKKAAADLESKLPQFKKDDLKILFWGFKKDGALAWQEGINLLRWLRDNL